jgi:hypothetical protein
MLEAKTRAIRLRLVTEITKENISYIKEFMKSVELRHLELFLESVILNTLLYP